MLVAAPESKRGAVGEESGLEKPGPERGPLASLRGTAEAAVATWVSVVSAVADTACPFDRLRAGSEIAEGSVRPT